MGVEACGAGGWGRLMALDGTDQPPLVCELSVGPTL